MQDKKRLKYALIMLLVITLGMVTFLSFPLIVGETIILKIEPVDPFDIFRGQYMTIRYEISSLDLPPNTDDGQTVYVLLAKGSDSIWHETGVSLNRPKSGTFIKGLVTTKWQQNVEYGIEEYFFERNAELPLQNLSAEIKVDSLGNARLVRLLHDGKTMEINYTQPRLSS